MGGISPVANGYQRVLIFPYVLPASNISPGPAAANVSVVTQREEISVEWKRRSCDKGIELTGLLPAGMETGTVVFRTKHSPRSKSWRQVRSGRSTRASCRLATTRQLPAVCNAPGGPHAAAGCSRWTFRLGGTRSSAS